MKVAMEESILNVQLVDVPMASSSDSKKTTKCCKLCCWRKCFLINLPEQPGRIENLVEQPRRMEKLLEKSSSWGILECCGDL
ncbi:hypothetical protein ACOSQ2_031061 [Xanthoceras sorbifolium]